jgi:hypothetical protein
MKYLIKTAVLALLLTSTEAIRISNHKNESSDIDADDQEIQEGPLNDEKDVAVFMDSVVNKGESVAQINKD